jgi:branched-subunit amino acid aminotransferase/4-amino-4-deoxychorismate lyase
MRVEVNGHLASATELRHPALVNYGHLTALQVRAGRVRGLDLHLARLDAANRELFGAGLDGDLVRRHLRHALAELADAAVRITVYQPDGHEQVSVLVAVRAPVDPPARPVRLKTVAYQRPLPHVKHTGGFAQIHFGRLAVRAGFDDALLVGPDGVVSETATGNVAMVDGVGVGVVWPDAPCLAGITMRLLETTVSSNRAPVRVADLPSYAGMIATNSIGIVAVDQVDDVRIPVDRDMLATIMRGYESVAWQSI